jgi:hypothetical protein
MKRTAMRNAANPTAMSGGSHQLVEPCGSRDGIPCATAADGTIRGVTDGNTTAGELLPPRAGGGSATRPLNPPRARGRTLAAVRTATRSRAVVVLTARCRGTATERAGGRDDCAALAGRLAGFFAAGFFECGADRLNGPVKVTDCPAGSLASLTPPGLVSAAGVVVNGGSAQAPAGTTSRNAVLRQMTVSARGCTAP